MGHAHSHSVQEDLDHFKVHIRDFWISGCLCTFGHQLGDVPEFYLYFVGGRATLAGNFCEVDAENLMSVRDAIFETFENDRGIWNFGRRLGVYADAEVEGLFGRKDVHICDPRFFYNAAFFQGPFALAIYYVGHSVFAVAALARRRFVKVVYFARV